MLNKQTNKQTQTGKLLLLVALVAATSLAAAPAGAADPPVKLLGSGIVVSQAGGYYSSGAPNGALVCMAADGKVAGAGFGYVFVGPTQVESLTIKQLWQDGGGSGWVRWMIKTFDVYANGKYIGVIELDQTRAEKTYSILDKPSADGGQPIVVTASWISLTASARYPNDPGYGTDPWGHIDTTAFYFNGTPCAPANVESKNLNHGKTVTSIEVKNNNTGLGNQTGTCLVDGNVASIAHNQSVFWALTTGGMEQSFRVTYGTGDAREKIVSIGIGLLADHVDRNVPKWVILSGSDASQSMKIYLDPNMAQYNRYDQGWLLDSLGNVIGTEMVSIESVFGGQYSTEFLKLTFPEYGGTKPANDPDWWFGTSTHFGLTEFEAFNTAVPKASFVYAAIPEPATMTLLALGGLAMLKKRRRGDAVTR